MQEMPKAVEWRNDHVYLLDQRKLPHDEVIQCCSEIEQVFAAIQTLTVRGAPAIGIAAAYGLLLGLEKFSSDLVIGELERRVQYLISARPTAVNLSWAVNRVLTCVKAKQSACSSADFSKIAEQEARLIHREDAIACHAIADAGLPLVRKYPNLLTHCNAGSLAVSELGTALAPIYRAHELGVKIHVFIDETRPLLQGARLTAYELTRNGVDCTLITDNMAAHMMSQGLVDMVIVGADRIASNGDTANKIGTLNLGILCQYFDIPFYIAAPLSTIDIATSSGSEIVIEERSANEIKSLAGQLIAPAEVAARSPAFDVTPNQLITGIITDVGILEPSYTESIANVFGRHVDG